MIIDSYNNKLERETKEKAQFTYVLGDLIGASVARLFDDKSNYPSIHEVFPELFPQEAASDDNNNWMLIKEQFIDFAEARNKKNRGD